MSADSRPRRERCSRQRQRVSLLVDGELGPRTRALVYGHLLRCRDCRRFLAELTGLAAALRSTAPASTAALRRRRLIAQPQRLALASGVAVLGIAVTMSGMLRGTAVVEIRALSAAQGWPVYSTPSQTEGLPVYNQQADILPPLAS